MPTEPVTTTDRRAALDALLRERAPEVAAFAGEYFRHLPAEDLLQRSPEELADLVERHHQLAKDRPANSPAVALLPQEVTDGWTERHTAIQIVTDDMPFLVDSVRGALLRAGRTVHVVIHPQLRAQRDDAGALGAVTPAAGDEASADAIPESWMHLEIDREADPQRREELLAELHQVLTDVRAAVQDWQPMRGRAGAIAAELAAAPPQGVAADEVAETVAFLKWLADNHFTFLGYRDYQLAPVPDGTGLLPVPGTGLGLLRVDPPADTPRPALSEQAMAAAVEPHLVIVTKANSISTIHRPVYLDYVSIKVFDAQGTVTGEHRFLGLFTNSAYAASVEQVPILRTKVAELRDRAGFAADSHSGKDLLGILEEYPREELFQASVDQLEEVMGAALTLADRRRARVFLRADDYGRFVSALVFIPRDRYTTAVRLRIEAILRERYDAEAVEYTARVSDSPLARVHYLVRLKPGVSIPEVDVAELNEQVAAACRTWSEDLRSAAHRVVGEDEGERLVTAYGRSFPTAYTEDFDVRQGVADIRNLQQLGADNPTAFALYKPPDDASGERRFKVFRREPISLTSVLPIFTDLGIEVVDERPYELNPGDGQPAYVYDFGLRASSPDVWESLSHNDLRSLFESAIDAVWNGRAESDALGGLVLGARLTWRQVVILRTLTKYIRQAQARFSERYLHEALLHNMGIAADLVTLFEARFDPDAPDEGRSEREQEITDRIVSALDEVSSLDEDRIIRSVLAVIQATLRTNFYQVDADGRPKSYVALKLDPTQIPELPAPRPAYEIWVYSPRVEGVHLRFGPVARGGLRWSDRREDFRTEVLGLVKAQMVKNAVIVPTGSKGGFYAKQLPDPTAGRQAWQEEGIAAYRIFISGLLDLTDNRVADAIEPPQRVVRHDGDDSYLVVAADKGTASFSDIANGVSAEYGFWLDDAFASGGSSGYDHKAMGITARGAWESVKRHFREMGVDTQTQEFTVVGIGDMSGDVFGNGMLLSEHVRLVAAFDHRHIFVDPEPNAASTYAERRRLFELAGSSWADYDASLISAGGGVFPRSAKSIPVTPQMVGALGLPEGTDAMTPAELITAILQAPVDLLWNGGIGTYVKAQSESDAQIGDRANDAIRIDGSQLRVKVVGEGGNLGFSQLGRIEAALAGVRINTDAIDNSAGVDTSDHEVNIKILLGEVMRRTGLSLPERDELLASMTDVVAEQVLLDNYEQNVLLGNARAQDLAMLPVHERFMAYLEQHGGLDRELEFLPSEAELDERRRAGRGLVSPEFSVLVAYAKLALKRELLASDVPDDPWLTGALHAYFPAELRERYPEAIDTHALRREIVATAIANAVVNRGGITFAFRAAEETGARPDQVARAFIIAREVFAAGDFVAAVQGLDNVVSTDVQTRMLLEFRRLLDRSVRWLLTERPAALDLRSEIERFRPIVQDWQPRVAELLVGSERKRLDSDTERLVAQGVPQDLAQRTSALLDGFALLDIADIASDTGWAAADVAPLHFHVSERLAVDELLTRISRLPREDFWDALARAALRDDLYGIHESITRAVIDGAPEGERDPARLLDRWIETHADTVERARRSLAGIARMERPSIAALSVALRTLRSVVRAGASEA